jgi:ATP-dependent DNA helicase RecQ
VGAKSAATAGADGELFMRLRALRKRLADENGIPPYVVFHDATLRAIAAHQPRDLARFAQVPGIGPSKLARYGDQFVAAIRESLAAAPGGSS